MGSESDYNVPNNVVVTSVYTVFRVFWPSEGKQLSQLTFNLHNAGQSQPPEAAASIGRCIYVHYFSDVLGSDFYGSTLIF